VLVREFLRTYLVVTGAMVLVAYMVFAGRLLQPGGEAPPPPLAALTTWQFWALAAGLVGMRGFIYAWDFVRGHEAAFLPPAAAGEAMSRHAHGRAARSDRWSPAAAPFRGPHVALPDSRGLR